MEIENELKAKVFALYLGQRVVTRLRGYNLEQKRTSTFKAGRLIEVDLTHNQAGVLLDEEKIRENLVNLDPGTDCQLSLRPLSAITDEDLTEVANMFVGKSAKRVESIFEITGCKVIRHEFKPEVLSAFTVCHNGDLAFLYNGSSGYMPTQTILKAYQYLESKGYDVRQHLLGDKTLFDAGLAIYEENQ